MNPASRSFSVVMLAGCLMLLAPVWNCAIAETPRPEAAAGQIVLARDGQPLLSIVVEAGAPAIVGYAAEELRSYLEKITGAKWPLSIERAGDDPPGAGIFVGATRAAAAFGIDPAGLEADGYLIASPRHDILILTGRDHRGPPLPGAPQRIPDELQDRTADGVLTRYGETGTLFAVYRLLRDLGVRWYLPGELGEVVPSLATVALDGLPVVDAPHFHHRSFFGFDYGRDPEAAKWMKRIGAGAESYLNINHSYLEWPSKYGRQHPEWFATIDGKADSAAVMRGNRSRIRNAIDFTEPGVLKQTVLEAEEYFTNPPWPGVRDIAPRDRRLFDIFAVMPNDSFSDAGDAAEQMGLLSPDRGDLGKFSDYVWGFVNRVAKVVGERFPDKFVGCSAYTTYSLPPQRLERFEGNVVVKFRQHILSHWSPEYRSLEAEALRGFVDLQPARIYIAEYYNLQNRYPNLAGLPSLAPHLIAQNIHSLKDIASGEVVGIQSAFPGEPRTGQYTHTGLSHLNVYVTAQSLWNPDLDVDRLLDEYYEKFYGPANEPMSRFFELLERNWMNPQRHGPMNSVPRSAILNNRFRFMQKRVTRDDLFPAADVTRLFGYLDEAQRLTAVGSPERRRVDFMRAEHSGLRTGETSRVARPRRRDGG